MRCPVKFEVDNFEHLCLEFIKNETGPPLSCNLHKIGENIYSILAFAPFCAKKYGPGWVDGWVYGSAGLRIAYSNKKNDRSDSKICFSLF